jgi:hypothetical protein
LIRCIGTTSASTGTRSSAGSISIPTPATSAYPTDQCHRTWNGVSGFPPSIPRRARGGGVARHASTSRRRRANSVAARSPTSTHSVVYPAIAQFASGLVTSDTTT